jgi:hypothetical protein
MADDTIGPEPMRTDPDFKMGIGQRILGIANNFLQGMAHHPAVTNTGRGAINEGKYGVAHSKWLDQAKRDAAKGPGGQQTGKQLVSGGIYGAEKPSLVDANQGQGGLAR